MKKGFTLIELLAVIVILSIIALISTPMIMNVIEDSRIKSYRRSAEGYLKSAENFYVLSETDLGKQDKIGKNIINELKVKGIEAKGEIYVYYNGEIDFALLIGDKCFTKRKDQSITEIEMSDEIDNCNIDFAYNKETTPKVEDENPGIICGTNEEDYTNANECHIKSAEDLIAFSTLVKSGKNFDKKTVYLDNSINLSKNISYVDSLNTTFGDINGDGKVEPLITELANSYPLSSTFKGTFEGNNNYIAGINLTSSSTKIGFIGNNDGTIKNLTIKNSNITGGNYTGVIGYSGGTIYNLSVSNCNITGGDYTGIVGYANNIEKVYFKNNKITGNNNVASIGQGQTLKNIITVDNEITGVNRVGGIAGYANKLTTAIVSNKVTSTGTTVGGAVGSSTSTSSVISSSIVTGVKEVAGLVGSGGYRNSITGLIIGGTVTGTNDVDYIEGYKNGGYDAYMSDTYKIYLNETEKVISETDALYAKVIDHEKMNNINIYNLIVDTWINGDNDGDGYYFDYEDGTDNIVIKDISTMISTLTGSGTEEDPYIINNIDDMKSATLFSNQTKYFKLNSDIDFSNQHFYSFASFNGVFDGNNHTLSNINTAYGIFTGNSGTIKNLIIDKANVYGKNSVGIITNTNSGSISNVEVKNSKIEGNERVGIIGEVSNSSSVIDKLIVHDNTITGKKYVGSVFGMHNNYGTSTYLISTNNNISGETSVGGITGYNGSGTINFAISSNNITCTVTDCGGIAGGASNGTAKNLISSSNINGSKSVGGLVGDTRTGSSTSGIVIGGTLSGTSNVGKLVGYQYSGGVSGLAYESVKRIINGVEDTAEDTSTIQEDFINEINTYDIAVDTWINGTTNNYYFDYDSLTKVVSIKPSTTITSTLTGSGTEEDPYIINNVSDMKSATLYSNQTKYFKLNSDIDFSNQTYYVFGDFNGVFDGNNHTLSNIKLNTAYAGLFRNNKGTIKNLKINKAIVTGSSKNIYSGIITSTNSGTIENIEITNSSLTGLGSKGGIGLIAGNNTGTITNAITNDNVVKGVDNVGGIAGLNTKTITTALSNNTITCTGTNCGGIMGQVYNGCRASSLISSSNIIGNKSVGGLVGDTRYGTSTTGLVIGGTLSGTSNVGKLVGYQYSGGVSGLAYESVKRVINGVEDTAEDTSTIQTNFLDLNTYDVAVDTWINGTTNNYYFDYDSSNKIVTKPSTTIVSTLTGSGTEEDPYIINNVSDMKSATLYSNQTKYFKLNSDIDFSNQTYYVFGDFNGVFDGNNHTLSNIKLNTAYAGLFRNNTGTIKNLKINKAIVTGSSKNIYSGIITNTNSGTIENIEITNSSLTGLGSKGGIGLIAGNNTGTITNVRTNNNTVVGVDNVGGIAGLNTKTITTALSNNTITCTGTNCGGIMGQVYNGCSATDLISSSNIIGNKSVGGLVGDTRYGSYTAGKVTNCTIRGNQTVGISVGYKYSGSVSGTYTSTVTKIGTGGVDGTLVEE